MNLLGSITPIVAMATSASVPLFVICWSIFALSSGRQGGVTVIKALASLLLWAVASYAMFVMFFIGTFMGGAQPSADAVSADQGNMVLVLSTLVYMLIGYGLAAWVRGKRRTENSPDAPGAGG